MANLEGDYKLNGFYMLRGTKGLQEGDLYFFPDGKAIGTIRDNNKNPNSFIGGPTPPKILLGYLSPENELSLLKIPDFRQQTHDVLWALKGEENSSKSVFKGGYLLIGTTGTKSTISIISGLEEVLLSETIPKKEALKDLMSRVNLDVLKQLIFTKEKYDFVIKDSRYINQNGEIVLEKLD